MWKGPAAIEVSRPQQDASGRPADHVSHLRTGLVVAARCTRRSHDRPAARVVRLARLGQRSGMSPDCDEGQLSLPCSPCRTSGPPSATHAGRAKPPRSRSFATSFPDGRFRLDGCTFTRGDVRGWSLPRSGSLVRALASLRRDESSSNAAPDSYARRLAARASCRSSLEAKSGGGGNRTRVRGRTGQNVYKRSPRFNFDRRPGTDALPTA
jgi:hypothetical protein